jgi:hypothetical protein
MKYLDLIMGAVNPFSFFVPANIFNWSLTANAAEQEWTRFSKSLLFG